MWIHYERLHNHSKAKHNKTVCIFLGIYCMSLIMARLGTPVFPWWILRNDHRILQWTHCLTNSWVVGNYRRNDDEITSLLYLKLLKLFCWALFSPEERKLNEKLIAECRLHIVSWRVRSMVHAFSLPMPCRMVIAWYERFLKSQISN